MFSGIILTPCQRATDTCTRPNNNLLTEAGASVHVQTRSWVAFAVVGSPGVHTSVLAASIVDLALINICRQRRDQRQTERDRWEINECNLTKFLHYGRGSEQNSPLALLILK